jgi:hypothetical protein
MSNGFSRHGIEHLSASSLNLWAAEPAIWVMERLLGYRSAPSALMARGKSVEDGIHEGLIDPSLPTADCIARALATYDRDMTLNPDERRASEREAIAGYVEHGLAELRQYGVPSAYQERVELWLDDVPVKISLAHARQGAIYARAHGNYGMRFAYVKPSAAKKDGRAVVVYELDRAEIDRQIAALRQIALRLERFLSLSADARELCGLIVPDYERYHWNNPTTRARRGSVRILKLHLKPRRNENASANRRFRHHEAVRQVQCQGRQVVHARP